MSFGVPVIYCSAIHLFFSLFCSAFNHFNTVVALLSILLRSICWLLCCCYCCERCYSVLYFVVLCPVIVYCYLFPCLTNWAGHKAATSSRLSRRSYCCFYVFRFALYAFGTVPLYSQRFTCHSWTTQLSHLQWGFQYVHIIIRVKTYEMDYKTVCGVMISLAI